MKMIEFALYLCYFVQMKKIKEFLHNKYGRLDIIFPVAVLCGVLLPWYVAVAAMILAFVVFNRRQGVAFAAISALALFSVWLHSTPLRGDYGALLAGRDCGGEAEIRLNDTALSEVDFLPLPPLVQGEVRRIRLTGEKEFHELSGNVMVRLPKNFSACLLYGDVWRIKGSFIVPASPQIFLSDGSRAELRRNFADYLKARNVSAVLYAHETDFIRRETGITGKILILRDCLVRAVASGMKEVRYQRSAAALFFGCRNGLNRDAQSRYIRSGTIHIFVVSGFHVGVVAFFLLWCLRPLPFRLRYLLLPAGTLIFVVMTGMNVPAMRAWLMITLWSLCRAALLYIPAVSILSILASVLILFNPFIINDAGFLYSFVITGVLLLLAGERRITPERSGSITELMPDSGLLGKTRRREMRIKRLWGALAGCIAAFLAGGAITLHFQGMWLPGSILSNIILLPVTGIMFQIAGAKLLLGWCWTWLDRFFASVLEYLFGFVDWITAAVAAVFDSAAVRMPAVWELGIFYLALFCFIVPEKHRIVRRTAGAVTLALLLGWWHTGVNTAPAVLTVQNGGMEYPCIALADPVAGVGVMVNTPAWEAVPAVTGFFRRHGIQRIDRIVFSHGKAGTLSGLNGIVRDMPVNAIQLPAESGRIFKNKVSERLAGVSEVSFVSGECSFLKISGGKNEIQFEYFNSGSNFKTDVIWLNTPEKLWCIGKSKKVPWETGNVVEIAEYEF